MSTELKPCPFCGNEMSRFAGKFLDAFARCGDQFAINCDCAAIGPLGATMEEAIEKWNLRVEGDRHAQG